MVKLKLILWQRFLFSFSLQILNNYTYSFWVLREYSEYSENDNLYPIYFLFPDKFVLPSGFHINFRMTDNDPTWHSSILSPNALLLHLLELSQWKIWWNTYVLFSRDTFQARWFKNNVEWLAHSPKSSSIFYFLPGHGSDPPFPVFLQS